MRRGQRACFILRDALVGVGHIKPSRKALKLALANASVPSFRLLAVPVPADGGLAYFVWLD